MIHAKSLCPLSSQSGSQQSYPRSNRRLTARRKLLEEAQEGSKTSTGCKVTHPSWRLPWIPGKALISVKCTVRALEGPSKGFAPNSVLGRQIQGELGQANVVAPFHGCSQLLLAASSQQSPWAWQENIFPGGFGKGLAGGSSLQVNFPGFTCRMGLHSFKMSGAAAAAVIEDRC